MTAEDVVIRQAAAGDLAALTALVSGAGLTTAGLPEAWRAWVADDGDEVVGGCALERHTDPVRADEPPAYLLRSLVMSPRMRGRGVGSRLVRHALAAAATDGGGPVSLLTETAIGYVERFGFRPVARSDLPAALSASEELRGACPASAHAYVTTALPAPTSTPPPA